MTNNVIQEAIKNTSVSDMTEVLSASLGVNLPQWWIEATRRGMTINQIAEVCRIVEEFKEAYAFQVELVMSSGKKRFHATYRVLPKMVNGSRMRFMVVFSPERVKSDTARGHWEYPTVADAIGYVHYSARGDVAVRMAFIHELAHIACFNEGRLDEHHGRYFCKWMRELCGALDLDVARLINRSNASLLNQQQAIDLAIQVAMRYPIGSEVILNVTRKGKRYHLPSRVIEHNSKRLVVRTEHNRVWNVPYECAFEDISPQEPPSKEYSEKYLGRVTR